MNFPLNLLTVKKIYAVNLINIDRKKTFHRTDRKLYALTFKFSGSTVYSCDGANYVADNAHLVLLPKNKCYSYRIAETGPCVMVEFDSDVVFSDFSSYSIGADTEIAGLFKRLARVWASKSNGYELSVYADLYAVLYKTHLFSTTSYAAIQKKEILRPALTYIQDHYNEFNVTNETLANLAGISVIYFRTLFKKVYHVSPMQYIRNIRLEKAKDLLLSDYNSVSYVAETTGFSGIYSFSRNFKKATGISPTEYKNQSYTHELK